MNEGMNTDQRNAALERLVRRIEETKRNEDETADKACFAIGDILYTAIGQPIQKVNAVVIDAVVDITQERQRGFVIDPNRYRLREYLDARKEEIRDPAHHPLSLVLHVPYVFTTGTHGSGERTARNASFPNITLIRTTSIGDHDFEWEINVGSVSGAETYDNGEMELVAHHRISLDNAEVRSVKLAVVGHGDFTRVYDPNRKLFFTPATPEAHRARYEQGKEKVF